MPDMNENAETQQHIAKELKYYKDIYSNYDELINKTIDIAANMQKVFKKYI